MSREFKKTNMIFEPQFTRINFKINKRRIKNIFRRRIFATKQKNIRNRNFHGFLHQKNS